MKQQIVRIEGIKKVKPDVYLLWFTNAYLSKVSLPGQFLHIKIDKKVTILRRPLSIHKVIGTRVYLLFRVRGKGTRILSGYRAGNTLDVIGPLGNGFVCPEQLCKQNEIILVAGGLGVAPLVFLAQKIDAHCRSDYKGKHIKRIALVGAKTRSEILCEADFKKFGFEVKVTTDDGSRGPESRKVTDLLKIYLTNYPFKKTVLGAHAHVYACGPREMFLGIKNILNNLPVMHYAENKKPVWSSLTQSTSAQFPVSCQVSFEQFMGCGVGACCGCVIETKHGYKKVCSDGPVFDIDDIW